MNATSGGEQSAHVSTECRNEQDAITDTMLVSLPRLASELKSRGLLSYSKRTYERWAKEGVLVEGRDAPLILKSRKIGAIRHSSVQWVVEFIREQAR